MSLLKKKNIVSFLISVFKNIIYYAYILFWSKESTRELPENLNVRLEEREEAGTCRVMPEALVGTLTASHTPQQ